MIGRKLAYHKHHLHKRFLCSLVAKRSSGSLFNHRLDYSLSPYLTKSHASLGKYLSESFSKFFVWLCHADALATLPHPKRLLQRNQRLCLLDALRLSFLISSCPSSLARLQMRV
ncbi:hypothetical protein DB41_DL00060 [Neochlamydia sp. TUME1]|nr:hypothetical protein DB41_DL00060 [Neochlamydia sp. TUME1]